MPQLANKFANRLLEMGKRARRAGKGFEAQCPAHPDRAASLTIAEGEDGKLLLQCHAGCSFDEILAAAAWSNADGFPPKNGTPRKINGNGHKPKAWPTLEGAVDAVPRTIAKAESVPLAEVQRAGLWMYRDSGGEDVAAVARFDLPTPEAGKARKSFRPLHRQGDGWAIGDPAGKWPLYRLETLAGAARVYLCEGEKASDAAAECGLVSTTSAHGAKSADKTDWAPLARVAEIILMPDNDEAGEAYARDAITQIRTVNPTAVVKMVRLAELVAGEFVQGGDFVDFSVDHRDGQGAEEIRAEIEAAVAKAVAIPTAAPSGPMPVLTCLADVEPKAIEWLWHNRIPMGRITLLVGRPGEGKSFLTLDIAARVTRGVPFPDGSPSRKGPVLFICAEDDAGDTIAPRAMAAEADTSKIHLLSGVQWSREEGKEGRVVVFTLDQVAALREAAGTGAAGAGGD